MKLQPEIQQLTFMAHPVAINHDTIVIYDKLKPRSARFQLECPMPIALRAPSREYISRFALRLGFVGIVDWNMWKSVARSSWPLQWVPASTSYSQPRHRRQAFKTDWAVTTADMPTNFPARRITPEPRAPVAEGCASACIEARTRRGTEPAPPRSK